MYAAVGAAALVAIAVAAPASAQVVHTVQPGETLWSIADANNFTTRALAAANGVPEDTRVVAGQTIRIPSEAEAASALADGGSAPGPQAPTPAGAYTVRPGDTLSGIAARSGLTLDQLARMNGLDPAAPLIAGTALRLPTDGIGASAPTPMPPPTSTAAPQPTQETVDPSLVQQVALEHGVSPSLAAAIAEQESGFNNAFASRANARGVMQVTPDAWQFVQGNLAGYPLDPASARENVHAGVMYLGRLLRDTGGDMVAATAAYYQGLSSGHRAAAGDARLRGQRDDAAAKVRRLIGGHRPGDAGNTRCLGLIRSGAGCAVLTVTGIRNLGGGNVR